MKHVRRPARSILVAIGLVAGCSHAAERPAASTAFGAPSASAAGPAPLQVPTSRAQDATVSDTVHVAPPAGSREADRASILAALERVRPGGTVQFATGTYRLGGRIIVSVPGITLLGSEAGTTLRGCDPADLVAYDDPALRSGSCAGLELTGARQTVRNLTFEHITWASLTIMGGRDGNALLPATTGGHLIEGNTFRDSDSFNVVSDASEPIVIRDNAFINTYHAVAIQGGNVHFLDNIISAPEPGRIPYGRPDIAIGIAQFAPTGPRCEDNLVVGNRIDGHPEGIAIGVFAPGASCRGNIVRGNTIAVGRATLPAWERRAVAEWAPWARTDSIAVGVAVRLLNYPRACDEAPPGPERGPMCPPGGSGQEALLSDNLIEGNRLLGGEGIAIEILYASGNRIADNAIVGIRSWEQFPAAVLRHAPGWARANGSGIWISPGSDENEIVGNTFEDVASDAIVIEGDHNRVETGSAGNHVRDLGSGNRVSLTADPVEAVRRLNDRFLAAWNDDFPDVVARFYAGDVVLTLAGGTVLEGRDAVVEAFIRPNVARLSGMAPVGDPHIGGTGDTVTLDLRYRARFAPAPDTVAIRVSSRWTLQPDGSWLITASTFELPSDNGADGPIRSRFVHSDGTRLHYLDFGGDGVPLVFIPSANPTAYTYIDFGARFTDRHRVLALTRRGSGQSGGEAGAAVYKCCQACSRCSCSARFARHRARNCGGPLDGDPDPSRRAAPGATRGACDPAWRATRAKSLRVRALDRAGAGPSVASCRLAGGGANRFPTRTHYRHASPRGGDSLRCPRRQRAGPARRRHAMLLVHDTAGLGWRERAPDRIVAAVSFPCHDGRRPTTPKGVGRGRGERVSALRPAGEIVP